MGNPLNWSEWLCHSNFSFLTGASHPEELVRTAALHGYKSLAITDYDGVYGIVRAHRALKKLATEYPGKSLPRLIFGADIHLTTDHHLPIPLQQTITLLAQNKQGYFNLCQLLTHSHRQGKNNAFIALETFTTQNTQDLVAILPMRGLIRQKNEPANKQLEKTIQTLAGQFKNKFYLCISKHLHPAEDSWISPMVRLSHKYKIPLLISQDAYFHHPARKPLSDLLHAMRINQDLNQASAHLFVNAGRCLMPLAQIENRYKSLPFFRQAQQNAQHLLQQFDFDLTELKYNYPKEMIPPAFTPQTYLDRLVWRYAKIRFGQPLPAKLMQALQHELTLVKTLNFADYFLTVWDIVRWARSQHILCQGRGSAANSAICFILGITALNPEKFDLLFERFISVERGDPPDIDVDFEHERREEVIQYIYRRFGRDKAAMVANVITFQRRGAIRFTGKALGIPDNLLSISTQGLKSRSLRGHSTKQALDTIYQDYQKNHRLNPPPGSSLPLPAHTWNLWAEFSDLLIGFPRHMGIHSGGFMLSDQSINHFVPLEPATMPGRTVIQWSKEDIEHLGFFKIDVLALGILTAMRKCFYLLKTHYGVHLNLNRIPPDDSHTYGMIQRADTVGAFQIESRAQIAFLPRHKPRDLYDLVVQVAIIRPGPIQGGMVPTYLNRRSGRETVTYPHPQLESILGRTYGVPIFQEQVMRVAMAVGGFSPGEANELRKNMGAFNIKGDVSQMLLKMEAGMRQAGIAEAFTQQLINQIKGFASYGFPESHAASFALLAYSSSYLKCHHPTAFYAALLNAQPLGFYTIDTLIKTAQHLGVVVLPVCLQHSKWDHDLTCLPASPSPSLTIAKIGNPQHQDPTPPDHVWGIRLGMRLIKGICQERVQAMITWRNTLPDASQSILDFWQNSPLRPDDFTKLAGADALQVFNLSRREAIWLIEALATFSPIDTEDAGVTLPLESEIESVSNDYKTTRCSLKRHPTQIIRENAWVYKVSTQTLATGRQIKFLSPQQTIQVFGMVLCRQSPPTAKGMLFITLEDETNVRPNLVIRPHIYKRFRRALDSHAFLCVWGKLEVNGEARNIIVAGVHLPDLRCPIINIDQQIGPKMVPVEPFKVYQQRSLF